MGVNKPWAHAQPCRVDYFFSLNMGKVPGLFYRVAFNCNISPDRPAVFMSAVDYEAVFD